MNTTRELFGGAITAVAPANLVDASDFRQVPDNQEVLLYPDSSVSIIVEVLERVDAADHDSAARFHFDSLAHDNSVDSESAVVDAVAVIPNTRNDGTPPAITLSGVQSVAKFNKADRDEVRVLMGLFRVENKRVDLVVTFNIPMHSHDSGAVDEEGCKAMQNHFDAFVRSLCIVDFGLFPGL